MSGTSLDGIDAVLAEITVNGETQLISSHYVAYTDALRKQLLDLHSPQINEIHQAELAANSLAQLYAGAISTLLSDIDQDNGSIRAIGCHGQTLRHRPDAAYTLQIGNAALLAELTGITVVADFRSRDIAAGGQGAPLVPAFHAHALRHPSIHRVIANIGGIANLTDLPPTGAVRGWDTGPGNMLLDAWTQKHHNTHYDKGGAWALTGRIHPSLLKALLDQDFFSLLPPKSAGREQFNLDYLQTNINAICAPIAPADVQASLLELTAQSLCNAIKRECASAQEVYLCGGGIHNNTLVKRITALLNPIRVASTAAVGIDPDWMEALAFAWLASQTLHGRPGNLPDVTGARGPRILGAIYSA